MKKCDIIIPVWNQLEVTRECVNSIEKHTDPAHRLIIIDNGSDEDTSEYLKGLKGKIAAETILIRNDKNLGFVKAVNEGIAVSDSPYLCVMNNDTIATAGWLEEMIKVMEANPQIGILNPSSNTSGQYPGEKSIDDYALGLKEFTGQIQELYACRGFCFLMRREVVEKVGLFDEIFDMGYFEETDYCTRAQKALFLVARAKGAYVYHKESATFKQLGKEKEVLFNKNEMIFFKKWGRPLKVGYFIEGAYSKEKIDDIASSVARNGHQITIFFKRGTQWPVELDHSEIRRSEVNALFFAPEVIYKILKRKKKKKIEVLLTDNGPFGKLLDSLKFLHGSDVMVSPDKNRLLEYLKVKSWQI